MTENQMWTTLIGLISAQLQNFGVTAIVQRGYQPTQQGAALPTQAAIILYLVSSRRYGHQHVSDVWNAETSLFDITEQWWLEQTIQIGAMVPVVDPGNPPPLSAYDLIDRVSGMLQSRHSRHYLLNYGIGFYRVTDMRTPYFEDDMGRNEMVPSFDLTLTYQNTLTYSAPKIDAVETAIHRV